MMRRCVGSAGRARMGRWLSTGGSASQVVVCEREQVVWVELDRGEVHNAFNEHVIADLSAAFGAIARGEYSGKAVVLSGRGKSFSAGADLSWMRRMAKYTEAENQEDARRLFDMFDAIASCPLPVVARVGGNALGGGAGLVACCDMAIGVRSALFGFTEVKLGLIPAVISPFVLRRIGANQASRFFLTGERFDGATAERIGLLHRAVDDTTQLDQELASLLGHLTANSPEAMAQSKSLIRKVSLHAGKPVRELREILSADIAHMRVSPDGQEGLSAFLEKRSPSWPSSLK